MTKDLILYLLVIVTISFIINFNINRHYKVDKFKLILFTCISIIVGVLSSNVMNWIESGSFKGTSFYGAIFLMPVYVVIFSFIFSIDKYKLLNLTSFLGMITCFVLKIKCYNHGCCGGRRILGFTERGYFIFPSQLVESVFALIVLIILILLYKKNNDRKDLYPWMIIIYGIGRLNLQTFRLYKPVLGFLAWGHIWSILSIIIGFVWLFILYRNNKRTTS